MRISVLENTSDQLRVRMTPTAAVFMLVFSLLLILGGVFTARTLGTCSELTLKNSELHYRKSVYGRLFVEEKTFPASEVEFDTHVYESSFGKTRDVRLRTGAGNTRIPFPMLDGEGKRKIAEDFNAAVQLEENHVESSDSSGLALGAFFGGLLAIGGLACLFFQQSSSLTLSRRHDKISISISRWLVPGAKHDSMKLSEFEQVKSSEMKVGGNSTPTASSNYVFIQGKLGKTIGLAVGPMFTEDSTAEIAELINTWISEPI